MFLISSWENNTEETVWFRRCHTEEEETAPIIITLLDHEKYLVEISKIVGPDNDRYVSTIDCEMEFCTNIDVAKIVAVIMARQEGYVVEEL